MEPYAEANCVLKVNIHCQACKMKLMEVLGSICGVYDVDYNSEEGLARVHGVVEPNLFLKALARTDRHAECKWVKLRHPKMYKNQYYYSTDCDSYNNYGHGYYSYGGIDDPYTYRRALPDYIRHPTHHYSTISPYDRGSHPYYYGSSDLPPPMYVPSYPPREYVPYADDVPMSFCSIM